MYNSKLPHPDELPTSRQLVLSTLLAATGAVVLLVAVILPAEYAIDPTGAGRLLGLTEMGEIKVRLAAEAQADAAINAVASSGPQPIPPAAASGAIPDQRPESSDVSVRSDVTQVTLAPGEAAEIKATAEKGTRIAFEWSVSGGGHVNYDMHGDPVGAPRAFYHGYGKGRASTGESGTMVAAFDGGHGWYWRNRSDVPVTVTLRTEGAYSKIRRVV
jgi:hypothetical protein